MEFDNFNAYTSDNTTKKMPSLEELCELMKETKKSFDKIRKKTDRVEAQMVEGVTCLECGRKITVTNRTLSLFSGITYVMCSHLYKKLLKHCQIKKEPKGPWVLEGVYIEILDDGPARF